MAKVLQLPEHLTPDKTLTKEGYPADAKTIGDRFVDVARYKYFNFVEIGVDVEGNPTYAEIKEAVENGYIPFLKYGKDGVAHMTVSNCGQNDDQNRGQFTFVTTNSRADMGWIMEVNEFWCYLQDDGSTLWESATHYSEAFVAEYNVTPTEAVIDAYEKGMEIIVKRSATPDQPAHYARLVRADGYRVTPNLTFTCEENQLSHHYHINGEGWHYWCYNLDKANDINDIKLRITDIENQKPLVAEYGVTKYSEILSAYKSGKDIVLCIPKGKITSTINKAETFLPLSYAEGSNDARNFVFTTTNNEQILHCMVTTDSVWKYYVNDVHKQLGNIYNSLDTHTNTISTNAANITKLLPLLTSAFNSFRGGFRNNAGTMHITHPGIYLILQGGTGNKQIIINQPSGEALNETWNGIIIMAYEGGVITPIGIKTSLTLAGTIQMPGTFQGWTSDGKYSTTINYPSMCVVAYLGNSNVNYLA